MAYNKQTDGEKTMATLTWRGGRGNDQASNAQNWSPRGAPKPGDNLVANHGTVNISGNQLPDTATLPLTGPVTVNLNNATGDHISAAADSTINMANSNLTLTH